MIVILGREDYYNQRIVKEINKRGERVFFFDTRLYPSAIQVHTSIDNPLKSWLKPITTNEKLYFQDIKSFYFYCYQGVMLPKDNLELEEYHRRESEAMLGSIFLNTECLWINKPESVIKHRFKVNQLKIMKDAGITIPESIVTNDIEELKEFYNRHNKKVLYKPLLWGEPKNLKDDDLNDENISKILHMPTLFQEKIDGVDIRVHLIDNDVFPTRIIRKSDDNYKTDRDLKIEKAVLPDSVIKDCFKIAEIFDLELTGVDLRETKSGEYVYFEANPSPQFAIYEDECGYDITAKLVNKLCQGIC